MPQRQSFTPVLWLILTTIFISLSGCANTLRKNCLCPQEIPVEDAHPARNTMVPIDHRLLEGPQPDEHIVDTHDVLGIYIADVIGDREELPPVSYPGFRLNSAPIKPFVGHPIAVETNGEIHLPYSDPIYVRGMTLSQVRNAIKEAYSSRKQLVQPGREHIQVTLITPRILRVHVFRQDTRYTIPGLQSRQEFEISRRWTGTTLYFEPKDASVLSALLKTGGLPGIDARNEIWVMKDAQERQVNELYQSIPIENKLEGMFPVMIAKDDSQIIKIPMAQDPNQALPFEPHDALLSDGDVVFLPRRSGDTYLTGGLLPPGRFPLDRDRDLDVVEAIAKAAGNNLGVPGAWNASMRFVSGPGAVVPPTEIIIVRRTADDCQYKIKIDLAKAMEDPTERVRIIPGDLIILHHKPRELALNVALNFFNFNYTISNIFNPSIP